MCKDCEEENPICDETGICVAPVRANGITNCIHCGKELVERNGAWYTWDMDFERGRAIPQQQEPEKKLE